MALNGKGFMIWKVRDCEGGNPDAIASVAAAAGLTHVHIKVCEEAKPYNMDPNTGADLAAPVVRALRRRGIQVWGWHYVYGAKPVEEARIAVQRVKQLALDGYAIDAEVEYKLPGRDVAAARYMAELRAGLPSTPIALCAYRFPSYHPQFPWRVFLEKCNYNMPQVYWEEAHNAGAQLARSVNEFKSMTPFRPIIPVGPVYRVSGWSPTAEDISEFLKTAENLKLSGVNFFSWEYGRSILKDLWTTISAYNWGNLPPVDPVIIRYFQALNARNAAQAAALYQANAVHVTAKKTVRGTEAIQAWHQRFLTVTFPSPSFTLTGGSGSDTSFHVTWQASSSAGKITNGRDTFGIRNGKIAYHYSRYTITS